MKVDRNFNVFAGQNNRSGGAVQTPSDKQQKENQGKAGSIFAGSSNLTSDSILFKKQQAQKQAMKVIGDVWDGDRQIDDDIKARREHISSLRQEMADANMALGDIEEERAKLQAGYGVADDSQEQKDIELLVKRSKSMAGGSPLSEDETQRLKEIDAQGLTEYQSRSMMKYESGDYYRKVIDNSQKAISGESAVISGIKKERLKAAPMEAASEQAEAIKEAASQEIVGILLEEAKDNIDQEQKEKEEEADKIQEKKEEQEELLENRKEEKTEAEELLDEMPTEEMLKMDQAQSDIQKEVQRIMDKMNLVTEDIKGAVVDQTL